MINFIIFISIASAANLPNPDQMVNKVKSKLEQAQIDQKVDKSVKIMEKVIKDSVDLSSKEIKKHISK